MTKEEMLYIEKIEKLLYNQMYAPEKIFIKTLKARYKALGIYEDVKNRILETYLLDIAIHDIMKNDTEMILFKKEMCEKRAKRKIDIEKLKNINNEKSFRLYLLLKHSKENNNGIPPRNKKI